MDGLKEILEKVSSYNIFNYLLPGILFVIFCKLLLQMNLIIDNNILGVFFYYFLGMVISRIGSVIIEPFLKWINFISFADYHLFVKASKIDTKIELLSEVNNKYRTITSMLLILLFIKLYKHFNYIYWNIPQKVSYSFLIIILLVLFIFSYRKQTNYITKRIKSNLTH